MPAIAFKFGAEAIKRESNPMAKFFTAEIMRVTSSRFSHAEYWFDGPANQARCFSARELNNGVGWATIDLSDSQLWSIVPLPPFFDMTEQRIVEAYCNGNVGRDYDTRGILGIDTGAGWHDLSDRFCSEMVMKIGQEGHVTHRFRSDIPANMVAPGWKDSSKTAAPDSHGRYGLYELATLGALYPPAAHPVG